MVLLTHGHADHFANAKLFKNAVIWISETDGNYLLSKDDFFTASPWFNNSYYPEQLSFFKLGQIFDIGQFKLKVIDLPGHTSGGIGLYDKDKGLLFSGDTLFKGTCGRYDLTTSNKGQIITSLKKLMELDYCILLSGHGPVFDTTAKAQKENIRDILEQVL
jgi:glyoxylase-like metal-dependent hydrolase (beta-lactamase superfamily II)